MFGNLQARTNTEMGLFALSVIKLVGVVMMLSHLLACSWYGIGDVPDGWVRIENETGIVHWDVGDQYLYTYQWSLSRLHPSTIEKNLLLRTTNERIFAVFGGLFAMVVGAGVISVVTNLLREFQEKHKRRKRNLALVQTYVLKHAISVPLAVRAKRYIDFEHEAKLRSEREAELLAILPHDMVLEFQHEAYSPVTNRHDFFAELHCKDLRTHYHICHKAISSTLVLSGEVVFTSGDACGRMRFVTEGALSYAFGSVAQSERLKPQPPGKDAWHGVDIQPVSVGIGLSEAVLWTPWEHRGELWSPHGGSLLAVAAEEFADVLRKHEQGLVVAAIHARFFVEELNATSVADLSDLPVSPSRRDRPTSPTVGQDLSSSGSGLLAKVRHASQRISTVARGRIDVGAPKDEEEHPAQRTRRKSRPPKTRRSTRPSGRG